MSGFSFGFFPMEEQEPDQEQELDPTAQNVKTAGNTSIDMNTTDVAVYDDLWNRSMKKPLHWMPSQELQDLLEERCDQELVCQEIQLTSEDPNDNLKQQIHQDIHDSDQTPENHNLPSVIRYVDVVYSSFVTPSTRKNDDATTSTDHEAEESNNTSVVQPGVYEGGLQLWECSVDLVQFLHQQFQQHERIAPRSASSTSPRILELGCGHGLPTMYWLRRALQEQQQQPLQTRAVTTQSLLPRFVLTDYNAPVVSNVVVSNLILNAAQALLHPSTTHSQTSNEGAQEPQKSQNDDSTDTSTIKPLTTSEACRLIANTVQCATGDWKGLMSHTAAEDNTMNPEQQQSSSSSSSNRMPPSTYDFILAAETLYTLESTRETALLIHSLLDKDAPHATAWVATKRYYFGVGGGTQAFQQECAELGLRTEIVQVYDNGRQNIREIIQVEHGA